MTDRVNRLATPGTAELQAARLLLERMGVTAADLLGDSHDRPPAPTFAEYIPRVRDAVGEGTRRVYGTYWNRVLAEWGERAIDEPSTTDVAQLAEQTKAQAVVRRNNRGGRSAAEHLIAALRCIYNHAVADGLIDEYANPARRAAKPRRLPSTRRGLPDRRIEDINTVAASSGNDPAVDALLLRLHTETACRTGGALALRPRDLDKDQCLILLREKGGTVRWQPVSPTLMAHLIGHAAQRGVTDPDSPLLRYANGAPLTKRRYDYLWTRLGKHLPWVATQGISTHWLRHTTLTWVERHFGFAVARAFAGHTDNNDAGTTATYIKANIHEVATALAALTGEKHPLALGEWHLDR